MLNWRRLKLRFKRWKGKVRWGFQWARVMLGWVGLASYDGGAGTAHFVADSLDGGCSMVDLRFMKPLQTQGSVAGEMRHSMLARHLKSFQVFLAGGSFSRMSCWFCCRMCCRRGSRRYSGRRGRDAGGA